MAQGNENPIDEKKLIYLAQPLSKKRKFDALEGSGGENVILRR